MSFQISEAGLAKIAEYKKSILLKKILLNYIIDSYAWWDRAYRWTHAGIALCAFACGTIDKIIGTNNYTNSAFVVLSGITLVMVKVKDYLKFDKIRDISKDQNVKYKQLYERIEREIMKPEHKQQTEDDFIYWIGREFNNIEISDPELGHSERKKFITYCAEHNIPYDNDIDILTNLISMSKQHSASNHLDVHSVNVLPNNSAHHTSSAEQIQMTSNTSASAVPHTSVEIAEQVKTASLASTVIDARPSISEMRRRSPSEEQDRRDYHDTLRNMNTKDDFQWAMERLKNME